MLMETTPTDNMSATLYDIVALVKRSEIAKSTDPVWLERLAELDAAPKRASFFSDVLMVLNFSADAYGDVTAIYVNQKLEHAPDCDRRFGTWVDPGGNEWNKFSLDVRVELPPICGKYGSFNLAEARDRLNRHEQILDLASDLIHLLQGHTVWSIHRTAETVRADELAAEAKRHAKAAENIVERNRKHLRVGGSFPVYNGEIKDAKLPKGKYPVTIFGTNKKYVLDVWGSTTPGSLGDSGQVRRIE